LEAANALDTDNSEMSLVTSGPVITGIDNSAGNASSGSTSSVLGRRSRIADIEATARDRGTLEYYQLEKIPINEIVTLDGTVSLTGGRNVLIRSYIPSRTKTQKVR
jgi:hypothetical protein